MHTRCLCHGDGPLPPTLFAKDFTKRLNFYQFLSLYAPVYIYISAAAGCLYIIDPFLQLSVLYSFVTIDQKLNPPPGQREGKKTPVIHKYENNRVNVSNVKLAIIEVYYFLPDDKVIRKSPEMFLTITRKRSNQ